MRTYFDCVPCSIRQVLDSVRMITDDETMHERVLRELLGMWQRMDMKQSPPAMAQRIHRYLRQLTGVADPYLDVKNRYNLFALGLYPELRERVADSPDPFETAVRLAIAGNIIDFGVNSHVEQGAVHDAIMRSLTEPIDRDAVQRLRQGVERVKDILFLGDNTGEIVLDRLLIEQMPTAKVTYVVRGHPILNDALMGDAQIAGLTDLVEVIDNGSDAPGTILETCSEAFRKRFDQADLVIAKGQGNYESLTATDRRVFFLLRPKCAVLARHLKCELGRLLVLHNNSDPADTFVV
ncbi:MAG: ARMT1-like domain-containing protein [Phycisphaerales bacterium]